MLDCFMSSSDVEFFWGGERIKVTTDFKNRTLLSFSFIYFCCGCIVGRLKSIWFYILLRVYWRKIPGDQNNIRGLHPQSEFRSEEEQEERREAAGMLSRVRKFYWVSEWMKVAFLTLLLSPLPSISCGRVSAKNKSVCENCILLI